MIHSKKTYKEFLEADKKALKNLSQESTFFNPFEIDIEIYKFQKALRRCEYLYNINKKNFFWKVNKFFAAKKFKKLSVSLGYTIPVNTFGPGLRILHRGTIIVNGNSKIGKNCIINCDVNIGTQAGYINKVPKLGDNIYIGPGAKLFGDIYIANGCVIGANAVVTKSCYEENTVLIGIPAKPVKKIERNLHIEI